MKPINSWAHAVVRGDGDVMWPIVLEHAVHGTLQRIYEGGRINADRFVPARWDLSPDGRYMWGCVQTVRDCPKHCSFCSVSRTVLIRVRFGGTAGRNTSGSATYEAQEPGDEGEPDIKRPPVSDIPEFESDRPEAPNGPGAPPFTGEDVEDVGRPHRRDGPPVM